jgi:UDP-N-acetylglucosamine:LPS N-acetylglucosamine transferase
LRARAAGLRGSAGTIIPFGFTDRIPELMAACDVVVTSPGQTCHEARLVGRPTVILDVVPGHGRENLLLSLAGGGAVASRADAEMIQRSVSSVLHRGVPPTEPWPVTSASQWQAMFLAAMSDLLPVTSST